MAGSIAVFLAILGGAVFLAALWKRRVAEMVPLSVLFLIAHTYLCGLFGLLRFSAVVTVCGMILLGVFALVMGLRRPGRWRPQWDASLAFFALGFAWLMYASAGRIPLEQADYTQWALAPKAMFYTGSLTPAEGTLAYPPTMAAFQTVFQVWGALLAPGSGYLEWLPYEAYGTACLALLLPFAQSPHPQKPVRVLYSLLFYTAALCIALHTFDLFSALNPDGFLAVLAAASVLFAIREKSHAHAFAFGLYLFVLTLIKDAGLFFSLAALAVYWVTLRTSETYKRSNRKQRAVLIAVPALLMLLARVTWPRLAFTLHPAEAGAGIGRLFWQGLTAKLLTFRVTLGGAALFTLYVSYLALAVMLTIFTVLLLRAVKARGLRDMQTALGSAPAVAALATLGLWLAYLFAIDTADAAKLLHFQRLAGIGFVFWMLLAAASAFRLPPVTGRWTWRRHLLTVLACACVILPCGDMLGGLTGRAFTEDNDKYHAYYAVADEALRAIPEDANVYIVCQSDDGSAYHTLRYALYPRGVNPETTWWLSDPEQKPNAYAYPVTAEAWKASLADYDYVLVYRADAYLTTAIAEAAAAGAAIQANTIYKIDTETGLLVAVEGQE